MQDAALVGARAEFEEEEKETESLP